MIVAVAALTNDREGALTTSIQVLTCTPRIIVQPQDLEPHAGSELQLVRKGGMVSRGMSADRNQDRCQLTARGRQPHYRLRSIDSHPGSRPLPVGARHHWLSLRQPKQRPLQKMSPELDSSPRVRSSRVCWRLQQSSGSHLLLPADPFRKR